MKSGPQSTQEEVPHWHISFYNCKAEDLFSYSYPRECNLELMNLWGEDAAPYFFAYLHKVRFAFIKSWARPPLLMWRSNALAQQQSQQMLPLQAWLIIHKRMKPIFPGLFRHEPHLLRLNITLKSLQPITSAHTHMHTHIRSLTCHNFLCTCRTLSIPIADVVTPGYKRIVPGEGMPR